MVETGNYITVVLDAIIKLALAAVAIDANVVGVVIGTDTSSSHSSCGRR